VHDLTDSEKHCEAGAQDLRPVEEESSGRYEYIPAQLLVIEDVCKKYACSCTVKTATLRRNRSKRAPPERVCWQR
jgi:transposase